MEGGAFWVMKAGLFCVCETRVSYRSHIVFFRPTGGELRQLQSHVARHAHVSLRKRRQSVARHGAGRNVRFK
jgi:hypothetical protein